MSKLTHFDESGNARMVDVSAKEESARVAVARGRVFMRAETLVTIMDGHVGKGDVLTVAQLAGIMAAKKTPDLIPLCHPLPLSKVDVTLRCLVEDCAVEITATCQLKGRSGVEMEALTAVSVASLTVYDMCKAIDKAMVIGDIHLVHKAGGKSGSYTAADGGEPPFAQPCS